MDFFTGGNDLGTLALGLVMAGAVAGFVSGAIGAGAGLVLVPSLYLVLATMGVSEAFRMHVAIGTALACLVPVHLSLIAAEPAKPDWKALRPLLPALLTGAVMGAVLGTLASGALLTVGFSVLALCFALFMALVQASPPAHPALGFALGLVATISGIGLDHRSLRLPRPADGPILSAGVAAIGALAAIAAGWHERGLPIHSAGFVNLLAMAVVSLPMLGAALAGRHFADVVDAKRLRLTFALFAAVIAAKMLWDALG